MAPFDKDLKPNLKDNIKSHFDIHDQDLNEIHNRKYEERLRALKNRKRQNDHYVKLRERGKGDALRNDPNIEPAYNFADENFVEENDLHENIHQNEDNDVFEQHNDRELDGIGLDGEIRNRPRRYQDEDRKIDFRNKQRVRQGDGLDNDWQARHRRREEEVDDPVNKPHKLQNLKKQRYRALQREAMRKRIDPARERQLRMWEKIERWPEPGDPGK